ncbi:MAG: hypothetical protein CBB92_00260 [Flammeovirgaceae bacterium TMED32]|nr:MAG: hypothetical protein CBB92_00260 [Flammeovirgaceae bacterium TMED32]
MFREGSAANPRVLVCGSIALDLLGRYDGSFGQYQSRYDIKSLNISLQLATLRTAFGGCGMNITYGLRQFGVDAVPLTAAGRNFNDQYRDYLRDLGVNIDYIAVDETLSQCATAIVLSDDEGNQITGFHAGGALSDLRVKPNAIEGIEHFQLAVLAPETASLMLSQARDLAELGIPIFFDPGQGLSEFTEVELRELIELSDYVICNHHEWDILQKNAGISAQEVVTQVRQAIVTRSARGVDIFRDGMQTVHSPAVPPQLSGDATGCGDAFRAGYVSGLVAGQAPDACARLGALTATFNLEHEDPQGYRFDQVAFARRYRESFGEDVPTAVWQV